MTAHDKAKSTSRELCELLLSLLKATIRQTKRREAGKVCSFGVTTKFAFVYHRRQGMRIYLRAKGEDGEMLTRLAGGSTDLTITRRHAMGSPWAKLTPFYLDVDNEGGVRAAIPLILYAARQLKASMRIYLTPSEECDREMVEGSRVEVSVSRVERDPKAREACIRFFGTTCTVCGFDFEAAYGKIGIGFIHVHHLNPLAYAMGERKVNPRSDLRPVCPNCHEMLHQQEPPFTIEELKGKLE